jgi:hypothetical protein
MDISVGIATNLRVERPRFNSRLYQDIRTASPASQTMGIGASFLSCLPCPKLSIVTCTEA